MTEYIRNTLTGNLAPVNSELEKIKSALDSKFDRNPSVGQNNELLDNLDANSNRIINYPNAVNDSDLITKGQVPSLAPVQSVNGATGDVQIARNVQIDNGAVFDNVAEMKTTSLEVGQLVRCKRYYSGGDLVDGLVYGIVANGTGVADNGRFHNLSNGNQAQLVLSSPIDLPLAFGVVGDNIADDTTSFAAMVASGGTFELDGNYKLTSAIPLTSDVKLAGSFTLSPTFTGNIFNSTASNVEIVGATVSNESTLLNQTTSFNRIRIAECNFTGGIDTLTSYLLYTGAVTTGVELSIEDNIVNKATVWFGDDTVVEDTYIKDNYITEPTRWAFRCLKQAGVSYSKRFHIYHNTIEDINGDLTDKSSTARAFQLGASEYMQIHHNHLNGAESTTASNFLYITRGSLFCSNNLIEGIKSISSISIIDDKVLTPDADQFWDISHNTFNQDGVLRADTPEACIRINESQNVTVSNNRFFNLKSYPCRFYHSVDTGNYPVNCSFDNNIIDNLDYPVVCQVYQNIMNVSISDNTVYSMSNTDTVSVNGRTLCRIADIYQSFDNGADIEDVTVRNNVLQECPTDSSIATIYRNAVAATSTITGAAILYNEIKQGATGTIVRFNGLDVGQVDIIGNVGPNGMTVSLGTTTVVRSANNVLT